MRQLPRVLAFTNDAVAAREDLGVRAAALAAGGPDVALVARLPDGNADTLAALADRFVRLARAPEAQVLVTGRADIAAATGAHGVILRGGDVSVATARRIIRPGGEPLIVLCSAHTVAEVEAAAREGADAVVLGTIWPSASHPGRPGAGVELLAAATAFGVPVIAIGGVTPARAREAVAAGAWGVAAIGALWEAPKPYLAVMEMLGSVTLSAAKG
jgi:thiamine-phosphate pyrophosphorylase